MTILQITLGAVKLIIMLVILIFQVNLIGLAPIVKPVISTLQAAFDALKSVLNPVLQYDLKHAVKHVTLVLVLWFSTSALLSLYLTPVVFISALWQYELRSAAFVQYLSETQGVIVGTLCCLFTLAEMAMFLGWTSGTSWVGGQQQQQAYRPMAPWAWPQVMCGFVRVLEGFALIPGGAFASNQTAKVGTQGREQQPRQGEQQWPGQVYGQNATMAGLNPEQLRQIQVEQLQQDMIRQLYLREIGGRF